jgi:hypothetical protein
VRVRKREIEGDEEGEEKEWKREKKKKEKKSEKETLRSHKFSRVCFKWKTFDWNETDTETDRKTDRKAKTLYINGTGWWMLTEKENRTNFICQATFS